MYTVLYYFVVLLLCTGWGWVVKWRNEKCELEQRLLGISEEFAEAERLGSLARLHIARQRGHKLYQDIYRSNLSASQKDMLLRNVSSLAYWSILGSSSCSTLCLTDRSNPSLFRYPKGARRGATIHVVHNLLFSIAHPIYDDTVFYTYVRYTDHPNPLGGLSLNEYITLNTGSMEELQQVVRNRCAMFFTNAKYTEPSTGNWRKLS